MLSKINIYIYIYMVELGSNVGEESIRKTVLKVEGPQAPLGVMLITRTCHLSVCNGGVE